MSHSNARNVRAKLSLPTAREMWVVGGASVAYLALTAVFIGLRVEHFALVGLFDILFFSSVYTRKMAVAMLPFIVFGVSYDWMRLVPNYEVNPIDVEGLYNAEKSIFGVYDDGVRVTLCEWFASHNWRLADLLSGIFYLCWVPVPIAFAFALFIVGKREVMLRFVLVFLLVNLIGFAGYYIHPAAPPWYVMQHGFDAVVGTPGSVAGLARFDALVGMDIFAPMYERNANVFAAVPSLHSAYMTIAFIYAIIARCRRWVVCLFGIIMCGIWFTAVYTAHHYLIDVLLGIACTLAGVLLFEFVLMRLPFFKRFMAAYRGYVA